MLSLRPREPLEPERAEIVGRRSLVLASTALLAVVVAGAASPKSRFTDPAGDSGGAADVTAVSVDNDASGNITIAITTNQPTLPSDAILIVPIDADQNPGTGSISGIEYSFQLRSTGSALDDVERFDVRSRAGYDRSRFLPLRRSGVRGQQERARQYEWIRLQRGELAARGKPGDLDRPGA